MKNKHLDYVISQDFLNKVALNKCVALATHTYFYNDITIHFMLNRQSSDVWLSSFKIVKNLLVYFLIYSEEGGKFEIRIEFELNLC